MGKLERETVGPVPRADVYAAIDGERDYQDHFVIPTRDYWTTHTLGEFILMINQYAHQAMQKWTHHADSAPGNEPSLHEVRKIAALAVRCMEQHGAPRREV
jgi:hypothetical protein